MTKGNIKRSQEKQKLYHDKKNKEEISNGR